MIKLILDFYRESQDAAKERLKLPIVPFYITLVILSYWRPISIYLFSAATIELKIKEINNLYNDWNAWNHFWTLLLLIGISIISSLIFPVIMWGIEVLLRTPNNRRKELLNASKVIEWQHDLASTQHKFDKEKILSGKKEIEEYNESIASLKDSYDERIRSIESITEQKDKNFESEIVSLKETNKRLLINYENAKLENMRLMRDKNKFIYTDSESSNLSVDFNKIFEILKFFIDSTSELIFTDRFLANISAETQKLFIKFIRNKKGDLFRKISRSLKTDELLSFDLSKIREVEDRDFFVDNKLGKIRTTNSKYEMYELTEYLDEFRNIGLIIEQLEQNPAILEYL